MLQKTELHTLKRDINTSIASILLFKKMFLYLRMLRLLRESLI